MLTETEIEHGGLYWVYSPHSKQVELKLACKSDTSLSFHSIRVSRQGSWITEGFLMFSDGIKVLAKAVGPPPEVPFQAGFYWFRGGLEGKFEPKWLNYKPEWGETGEPVEIPEKYK